MQALVLAGKDCSSNLSATTVSRQYLLGLSLTNAIAQEILL
ncbi:MAG TPA: hypothetical protein VI959_04945 [Alphaproteobacteria bacterium]|nr:hypothetical protein [Alphaproteobacteria bacterium]